MKRAWVLGGGGSRGAYQMGAWRALRELGKECDMVVGTSIGAINAALVAQDDFDLANHLWNTVTLDQVMKGGVNLYPNLEKYFDQGPELRTFLRGYAKNLGADISPLVELLRRSIDEAAVRASRIEMGLVTVRFPTLTPLPLMARDIAPGLLHDYLIASAACFPAFPIHKIADDSFIDGGYFDNLPVNLALSRGADEVIAISLFQKPPHEALLSWPYATYIGPSQPLGSIMLFDREPLTRSMNLGYNDAMRAFCRVLGHSYSFTPESACPRAVEGRAFFLSILRLEADLARRNAFRRVARQAPLTDAIRKVLPPNRTATDLDILLAGAEICAARARIDPVQLYDLDALNQLILERARFQDARAFLDQWLKSDLIAKVATLTAVGLDLLPAVLMLLLRSGELRGALLTAMLLKPDDLIAACYLNLIAPELSLAAPAETLALPAETDRSEPNSSSSA